MLRKKRVVVDGRYSISFKGSKKVPHVFTESSNVEYKYCSKCATLKELDDFSNNKNTWDEKTSFCKGCSSKVMKQNYLKRAMDKLVLQPHYDEIKLAELKVEYAQIVIDNQRISYTLDTLNDAAKEQLNTEDFKFVYYIEN